MVREVDETFGSGIDKLEETIADQNAKIGERIHALLLLLRSRNAEEENLQVNARPASPQLSESPDFNRPEPKPNYGVNVTPDAPNASSLLSNRKYKVQRRISCEEIDERRLKGLCVFCEEPETPTHYLQHKNSGLIVNEIGKVKKDLVEIGVVKSSDDNQFLDAGDVCGFNVDASQLNSLLNQSQLIQEQAKNHYTDSTLETSLHQHRDSFLTHQVSNPHWEFGRRSYMESMDVYDKTKVFHNDDLPSTVVRTHQSQSQFVPACVGNIACQVFDIMPLGRKVLQSKRRTTFSKTWKFKFKQRRQHIGRPSNTHKRIYKGFSKTWSTLNDDGFLDGFKEEDQVVHETSSLWLFVRFKFWKFKFINRNLQKMMRGHGYASHLKLMTDMREPAEMFIVARAVGMRFLLGTMLGTTESDAGEEQQTVYEKIIMMNEWLFYISLVLQQVMRNTKIKFSKRWWFKYKFGEEGLTRLSSSNWCMTYYFAVWHCWNSKIMVYVAMSGDHWFWIISVRRSATSSFLLHLYDHRMGVPSILRFCLLKELNQVRHELCSENKGCLDFFQALVIGITNSSSSEEEWMKEEPYYVKVNKVTLEIQTCHLKFALIEAKMMGTKTKSLCNEESVYILEDLSAVILEKNQSQIYCGIDCDDFQCGVFRFWEFTAFDKIPLGRTVLTKGREKMFYKSRRSKFKHRVAPRGLQSGFEILFWRLAIHKLGGKATTFRALCQRVDQLVKMESAKDVTQSQTFDPGIGLKSQETL